MPYVLVRESYVNTCCLVEGLPLNESKFLGERCQVYPESRDEKQRRLEFPISAITILNSLEQMGYRVVTSGAFVASQVPSSKGRQNRFSQKEFIWTVHKKTKDLE